MAIHDIIELQCLLDDSIAFGSNVPRLMFPLHTSPTRFGIEQCLRGQPHIGPASYQKHPVSMHRDTMQTLLSVSYRVSYSYKLKTENPEAAKVGTLAVVQPNQEKISQR